MDPTNVFRVDGMVAAVTGGGTGMGLVMANALAAAGAARVYILGRREEVLREQAESNPKLFAVQCDITSKDSLQSAVDIITQESGYLNLLIANAGTSGPPGSAIQPNISIQEFRKKTFEDVSNARFTETFDVNVTGTFFTIMAFIELLHTGNERALKGGFGSPQSDGSTVPSVQSQVIVNSSAGAFVRHAMISPAYVASKAATTQLVKYMSTWLSGFGIRVNALAPGVFPTELATRSPMADPSVTATIPARRFGGAEELKGTLLYLASRAGSYCDGLILVVDGGTLAIGPASY